MNEAIGLLHDIGRLPREKGKHHWADYVELLTLTHLDGEFSPADLIERWDERDDLGEEPPDTLPEDDADSPVDAPDLELGAPAAARDDGRARIAEDLFQHLAYRATAFGDAYPFEVETGTLRMIRRRSDINGWQRLYVFLLLASSLRYITKARRKELTRPFERLAAAAMRQWLSEHAQVHLFGTAATDQAEAEPDARYTGLLWPKLEKLGTDLREMVLLSEAAFADSDTGDLGLDVVAWFPLGDMEPGLPALFAQATCLAQWKGKQHESGINWDHYLKASAPRGNLLFIPFCFRDPSGAWYDPRWPIAAVLIDRLRLLWVLRTVNAQALPLPDPTIDAALGTRLPPT